MSRRSLSLLLVIFCLFFIVSPLHSQNVTFRTRIGNLENGSVYVSTGPLAGNIAVLDAYDVFAFPLCKPHKPAKGACDVFDFHEQHKQAKKVFDLKALAIAGPPSGIAYIPGQQLFVFCEVGSPTLFLSDSYGQPQGTITITRPDGWLPNHIDGIVYIPVGSPNWPDHFVVASNASSTGEVRYELVNRSTGNVNYIIFPQWDLTQFPNFQGGLDFYFDRQTLLGGYGNQLIEFGFDGIPVRTATFPDMGYPEGVTLLPGNAVVVVGYQFGWLKFFDANLNPTPALDRSFLFPPELHDFQAVACCSHTNQYLVRLHYDPVTGFYEPGVWTLNPLTHTATKLFSFPPDSASFTSLSYASMVYLPDEQLLAILYRQNSSEGVPAHPDIHLYDRSGNLVETIHVWTETYPHGRSFVPGALTYLPKTRQFLTRHNLDDPAAPNVTLTPYVVLVNRDNGTVAGTIDLTAAGMAAGSGSITYFNDGAEKLLFRPSPTRYVVTNLAGTLLLEFNPRTVLGLVQPMAITFNDKANAFATLDGGEFILFELPKKAKKK